MKKVTFAYSASDNFSFVVFFVSRRLSFYCLSLSHVRWISSLLLYNAMFFLLRVSLNNFFIRGEIFTEAICLLLLLLFLLFSGSLSPSSALVATAAAVAGLLVLSASLLLSPARAHTIAGNQFFFSN